jgi:hypothetical protein
MAIASAQPERRSSKRDLRRSSAAGILLLFASLVVNYYAGRYATQRASNPVTDLILTNTPVFEVGGLFVYSFALFLLFIVVLLVVKPRRTPFTLKAIALFVFVRSFFITMTHLGPFPTQAAIDPSNLINWLTFGGDLFFSGHTGLPFLMALVYWNEARLRALFLGASAVSAIIVLSGHLHYSIDVFAAFFITYGVFRVAEALFQKDRQVFQSAG